MRITFRKHGTISTGIVKKLTTGAVQRGQQIFIYVDNQLRMMDIGKNNIEVGDCNADVRKLFKK
jgi:hypothetical protein